MTSQSAFGKRSQEKLRSTCLTGAGAESKSGIRARQRFEERSLERLLVAGLDEPAVDAVLELVARRDRGGTRHDDRLPHRHRLQQRRRRARIAVVPHRQRHDAGGRETLARLLERDVRFQRRRSAAARRGSVRAPPSRRCGSSAPGGAPRSRGGARSRGADRRRRKTSTSGSARPGRKASTSTPKGTKTTGGPPGPTIAQHAASFSLYATTAVPGAERCGSAAASVCRGAARAAPEARSRRRRPADARGRPLQQDQRDPDRVDRREHTSAALRAEGGEHGGEVPAVAADAYSGLLIARRPRAPTARFRRAARGCGAPRTPHAASSSRPNRR